MNYQRIYDEIINNAKSRGLNKKLLDGYFERHHIVPKCLNGTNDKDNLVLLTAREHYLCHWLLWKIHKDNYKLLFAYNFIRTKNKVHITSKQYEILKIELSKVRFTDAHKRKISESHIGMLSPRKGVELSEETKEKIRLYNIGRTYSDETKQKHRDAMKGFKHSEETKKRLSRPKTDEVKQKMKQAALKREKLKRELKQNFQKIN